MVYSGDEYIYDDDYYGNDNDDDYVLVMTILNLLGQTLKSTHCIS